MSMLEDERELNTELEYNVFDTNTIINSDDPDLLAAQKELPFDVLSSVVNARASKCYSLLRSSPEFGKYVKSIAHINPECVTEEMLQDFLRCDLEGNENWVDLAIELKSAGMINKLREKAAARIIGEDNAELFALINNKDEYIEEVFRRNKYNIAMSLNDKRVGRNPDDQVLDSEFVVIKDGVKKIPNEAFNDMKHLKYIIIPPSVCEIGHEVLNKCTRLRSIVIPPSVTHIGCYLLNECPSLVSFETQLPITSIDDDALCCCDSLMSIRIQAEVLGRVDSRIILVSRDSLAGLHIENSNCVINGRPFMSYEQLTDLRVPSSVKYTRHERSVTASL